MAEIPSWVFPAGGLALTIIIGISKLQQWKEDTAEWRRSISGRLDVVEKKALEEVEAHAQETERNISRLERGYDARYVELFSILENIKKQLIIMDQRIADNAARMNTMELLKAAQHTAIDISIDEVKGDCRRNSTEINRIERWKAGVTEVLKHMGRSPEGD
jgi:hypothetical protein